MTKFVFTATDEESIVSVEFETDAWPDAFPKFLQLMRGTGFNVNSDVKLYAPQLSSYVFDDRDYLLTAEDIESMGPMEVETAKESDDPSAW